MGITERIVVWRCLLNGARNIEEEMDTFRNVDRIEYDSCGKGGLRLRSFASAVTD
jgi:hypothetical protein